MAGNTWKTETLVVTIGAAHAQLGKALEIWLTTQGNGTEAFFDNVRLDASLAGNTVPEPGTWMMFAAGLALVYHWRKRA